MAKLKRVLLRSGIVIIFVACALVGAHAQTDPLPSWNDTAPKKAIIAFVEKVTKHDTPDFVPVDQRIATLTTMARFGLSSQCTYSWLLCSIESKSLLRSIPNGRRCSRLRVFSTAT